MNLGLIPLAIPGASFAFTVSGDFGSNSNTNTVLSGMDDGVDFAILDGDFSYAGAGSEVAWCDRVKQQIPGAASNFPVPLVTGNHEDDDGPDGYIGNYVQCLPNILPGIVFPPGSACGTLPNCYGDAYYFDYPSSGPIARFVFIYHTTTSTVGGIIMSYSNGTGLSNWVLGAIDSARTGGLWTFLISHKPCLSTGGSGASSCEIMKSATVHGVDMIISGHDHNYQRSKQVACFSSSSYVASCVKDDGSDNAYTKGNGVIQWIVGVGGDSFASLSTTNPMNGYFAKWDATTYGFGRVLVQTTGLSASFISRAGGTYSDSFTIGAFTTFPPIMISLSWLPVNPIVGDTVWFSISTTNSVFPATLTINYGDGSPPFSGNGLSALLSHSYSVPCSCPVTASIIDANGQTASITKTIIVTSPVPALTFSVFWSPQLPKVSETITFGVTITGGSSPYIVSWLFGDATGATGASVTHTYSQSGSYNVITTVTDAGSQSNSQTNTVPVQSQPGPNPIVANFNWNPLLPVKGQTVTFSSQISGGVLPYQKIEWSFGDGVVQTGFPGSFNITHSYLFAGTYTVGLVVIDANSVSKTVTNSVTIVEPNVIPPPSDILNIIFQYLPYISFGGAVAVGTVALARRKK